MLPTSVCLTEVLLHAGAITLKPLDSSKKWETLDGDAKDILESLLHDLPERRLTAAQLLHNPWLYHVQGKLFPTQPIFAPAISPVPPHISHHIQRRQRHTQLLPVILDPFRANMGAHFQQPKQHMAGQQGGPPAAGREWPAEALARRLHPYPSLYTSALGSTKSGSVARGPRAPLAAPSAAAAPPSSSHSFYTVVPQPQPLGLPDKSLYPYSVLPKQPSLTHGRPPLQGPAVYLGSGTPDHGQYASADSESLSDSQSSSASESLTGSMYQSGSESLRSASEYSSSVNGSSSVSFARSEDSSSISDGDSQDSTSGMGSDVEMSHDISLAPKLPRSLSQEAAEGAFTR